MDSASVKTFLLDVRGSANSLLSQYEPLVLVFAALFALLVSSALQWTIHGLQEKGLKATLLGLFMSSIKLVPGVKSYIEAEKQKMAMVDSTVSIKNPSFSPPPSYMAAAGGLNLQPQPYIFLPQSVEQLLRRICEEKKHPWPEDDVLRRLSFLTEKQALELLRQIARAKEVKTLNGYIIWLCQTQYSSSSPSQSSLASQFQGVTLNHRCSSAVEQPVAIGNAEAELEALGELEFRKQFLILNYSGGKQLGSVIAAETIRSWKDLPMHIFETRVWEALGRNHIGKEDRRLTFEWDSGKTHLYHCYVSLDGSCKFKGPFLNKERTLLQKVLGDDNVLMMKFADEGNGTGPSNSYNNKYVTYRKVAREGILVGLRRFRFFVFKDGGKEEKKKNPTSSPVKCYFVRMDSDASIDRDVWYMLTNRTIYEARSLFMHAHTVSSVPTYMARFSLVLSKTIRFPVDLSVVNVEFVDEEYCRDESGNLIYRDDKPLIHTDGTGFISEDLALLCPKNISNGKRISNQKIEPLLIQFRLFYKGCAVKGTFLVNKMLPPKTVQIRPSMVKVQIDPELSDNETVNALEIVGTSIPPGKSYLSRNLIALLFHGGVPKEYFLEILERALEDAHSVFCNARTALKVAVNNGEIDDNSNTARMILCGIPLDESYLQYRLSILIKEEMKGLRRGKLYVPDCYYLMGTADPTGILEKDEVCIILDSGQISGKVLVYRNPGLHFGDIHVLKATYVKELEYVVGNAKYAIFFSRKGPRSVADEISGGDFDGDLYWVSRNPQLLEYFKPSEPWVPASSAPKAASVKPAKLSKEDLEEQLINLFLTTRFKPSYAMSEAADSWLAMMDRYLTRGDSSIDENLVKNILRLVDIYYDALDAPKKGGKVEVPKDLKVSKFPHYMEKKNSYRSTSILGSIYDRVNEYQPDDLSTKEVKKLPIFDVEVPEECLIKWREQYKQYRRDMTSALRDDDREGKNQAAGEVITKYREILYGGDDFDKSTRPMGEIFDEAIAIYNICYDYARSAGVSKCVFAWKVAGSALIKLHLIKQGDACPFLVSPAVLKDIL
ncbi:hypothetical protein TB2_017503 [Malus domestica]